MIRHMTRLDFYASHTKVSLLLLFVLPAEGGGIAAD